MHFISSDCPLNNCSIWSNSFWRIVRWLQSRYISFQSTRSFIRLSVGNVFHQTLIELDGCPAAQDHSRSQSYCVCFLVYFIWICISRPRVERDFNSWSKVPNCVVSPIKMSAMFPTIWLLFNLDTAAIGLIFRIFNWNPLKLVHFQARSNIRGYHSRTGAPMDRRADCLW